MNFHNEPEPTRDVPTNGEIARRTRRQGGATSYTHPSNNPLDSYDQPYSAKGLPIDAALNLIDVVDVMGYTYEPTLPLWYRLLNCGLRLPAAAGTDVFLNRMASNPPGFGRVYVRVEGKFTYERWVAAMRAGHTFVSSSPMMEFSVNGAGPGGVVRLDAPGEVTLKGKVWTNAPVAKLEVIQDGKARETGKAAADGLTASIEEKMNMDRSGWLALRTSGAPCEASSLMRPLAAHTSAVWVEVKDRPADSRRDAEYFLRWIGRLEADLKKRNRLPPDGWNQVAQHLAPAREYYRRLLQ